MYDAIIKVADLVLQAEGGGGGTTCGAASAAEGMVMVGVGEADQVLAVNVKETGVARSGFSFIEKIAQSAEVGDVVVD